MKKIMFNDKFLLTDAVLNGRKTQTRRIITPQPELSDRVGFIWKDRMFGVGTDKAMTYRNFIGSIKTPYRIGEVVAIAQSYSQIYAQKIMDWQKHNYHIPRETAAEKFKSTFENSPGWKNKMFVKSELMPHKIMITNIRIERLQDISDEDCIREGIVESHVLPRDAYKELISHIVNKETWERNPWVFVYD